MRENGGRERIKNPPTWRRGDGGDVGTRAGACRTHSYEWCGPSHVGHVGGGKFGFLRAASETDFILSHPRILTTACGVRGVPCNDQSDPVARVEGKCKEHPV